METLDEFSDNPKISSTKSTCFSGDPSLVLPTLDISINHIDLSNLQPGITIDFFLKYLDSVIIDTPDKIILAVISSINKDLCAKFKLKGWNSSYIVDIGELGHGASGDVKKVFDRLNCKIYAKKTIRVRKNSKTFDTLALNEIKPLLEIIKIDNRKLLDIYHIDYEPGVLCSIYMEIGRTLQDFMIYHQYQKKVPENFLSLVETQLFEQIKILSDHNICHRDIKPANIILNEKMKLKLADYGVAEFLAVKGPQSMMIKGTIEYMMPLMLEKLNNGENICVIDPFEADKYAVDLIVKNIRNVIADALVMSQEHFDIVFNGAIISLGLETNLELTVNYVNEICEDRERLEFLKQGLWTLMRVQIGEVTNDFFNYLKDIKDLNKEKVLHLFDATVINYYENLDDIKKAKISKEEGSYYFRLATPKDSTSSFSIEILETIARVIQYEKNSLALNYFEKIIEIRSELQIGLNSLINDHIMALQLSLQELDEEKFQTDEYDDAVSAVWKIYPFELQKETSIDDLITLIIEGKSKFNYERAADHLKKVLFLLKERESSGYKEFNNALFSLILLMIKLFIKENSCLEARSLFELALPTLELYKVYEAFAKVTEKVFKFLSE